MTGGTCQRIGAAAPWRKNLLKKYLTADIINLVRFRRDEDGKRKYYIAVNAGDRYPLLKTPQDYTDYFNEALSFGDLSDVLRYIEKHGLGRIVTAVIKR